MGFDSRMEVKIGIWIKDKGKGIKEMCDFDVEIELIFSFVFISQTLESA